MRIYGFVLVVLVLAPVCRADVGEFFDKLFGVFKPEGIVVTDAPNNATGEASNHTAVETVKKTGNDTEAITGKLTSILVESLSESEEDSTSEATTNQDTTISSTGSTTTTVVYKLFHPNTTSTATSTTTSTTASSPTSTLLSTAATVTTSNTAENTSHVKSTTSLIPSAPESGVATLAPSLASTAIVNDVLCKTSYDPVANLKVTSCGDSTTPKVHSKREAGHNVEPLLLADTIQQGRYPEESYPSGSEIGDDDGDVFGSNRKGEYGTEPFYVYA